MEDVTRRGSVHTDKRMVPRSYDNWIENNQIGKKKTRIKEQRTTPAFTVDYKSTIEDLY